MVNLQAMLDAEAALAAACAEVGLVPQVAADEIAAACRAELYDAGRSPPTPRAAGNPGDPAGAGADGAAVARGRRHVHRGATSQDIIDTAMSADGAALGTRIAADLRRAGDRCAALAAQHRTTPMAGRTLLQQAVPTTFGLKAAGWLRRSTAAARDWRPADGALAVQLGGAAGTLAALGDDGPAVAARSPRGSASPRRCCPGTPTATGSRDVGGGARGRGRRLRQGRARHRAARADRGGRGDERRRAAARRRCRTSATRSRRSQRSPPLGGARTASRRCSP